MNRVPPRLSLFLCLLGSVSALMMTACESRPHSGTLYSADMSSGARTRMSIASSLGIAQSSHKSDTAGHDSKPVVANAQPTDELWIISRGTSDQAPPPAAAKTDESYPGTGALAVESPDSDEPIPLPLKHTKVDARVDAFVSTVEVTQQFHNPYDTKIEAVYVFPLPQNAAVNEFVMTIGERRIRGIIREREEAERVYYAARRQGYTASLMTQERPNIFTQRVANIEPGKAIDVNVRYYNTLAYVDGWYEFVFPMVVGPRFNPPDTKHPIVPAPRRGDISPHASGGTKVPYLKPHERSGHDIALNLTVNAGVPIEQVECRSHVIEQSFDTPESLSVALAARDRIPNKDFVLRFRVAGERMKTGLIVQRDLRNGHEDEGYFTLMLYPPSDLKDLQRAPVEMIFVLDCSGSMSGHPMAKSKEAMLYALSNMQPNDTFQIIRFSNNASQLGPRPIPATDANLSKAMRYVKGLKGQGGTRMIEGIKAALDFPHDPQRLRVVAFLTDGYIGNDAQILGEMKKRLGASRVFSFGVGSSPNRYLLERMAKLGRGAVAYVGLRDDATDVMRHYFERTSHPALTDVSLDFGSAQVSGVFPRQTPDVFVGRPVVVTGRYKGAPPTRVTVRGGAGGGGEIAFDVSAKPQAAVINAGDGEQPKTVPALGAVWARMHIADLMDQATFTNDPHQELAGEVKRIALDYSLMSAYTAFVAVDSSRRTEGGSGTTVHQPVPVPEGVRYETTVPDEPNAAPAAQ